MKNVDLDLSSIALKYESEDATIEGPFTTKDGEKQYIKAKFLEHMEDEDGFIGQSRSYTKVFFEDSHSVVFNKALKCLEDNTPLRIKAARITMPTDREFYILDSEGKKMLKKDKSFRKAKSITLFLLKDENPLTAFNAAVNRITEQKAWIAPSVDTDDYEDEEEKTKQEQKPANKSGKK
jgi:hypothetical protein